MTHPTDEELDALVNWLDELPCCHDGPHETSARCKTCEKSAADAITALRAQLAEAKADKEKLGRELNLARYGQPDFSWQVHKEALAAANARADRAEAALAALEPAPRVNETPKSEHDRADVLTAIEPALATPAPDAVQEAAIDIAAIENGGKRWHGEDHRVVAVRWEPYKPDGQRQMKAKGRWQEQVGSGDYWRWRNCDRPVALRAIGEGEA